MADIPVLFNRNAVNPIECLKSGFALIKDRYWLFFGITAVGILIAGLVPMAILMGPMMCGIYLAFFERMRGRPVDFGLLFKGFDFFRESLIATLLVIAPVLILIIPCYALFFAVFFAFFHWQQRAPGNAQGPVIAGAALLAVGITVFVLILTVIGVVIRVLLAFVYLLIVDRKLSALEAVKTSIRAGMANFWRLAALVLLDAVLSMAGVLCCYIGVFLTMPVTLAANAMAYRQVFGLSTIQPPAIAPPPIV